MTETDGEDGDDFEGTVIAMRRLPSMHRTL